MAEELHLLGQGNGGPVALVQDVPHQLRELLDARLRLFRVDVHERVDVVEGVHEEVRVDLVAERFQLPAQVLRLQFLHPALSADRFQIILHAQVHPQEQHPQKELHQIGRQRHPSTHRRPGTGHLLARRRRFAHPFHRRAVRTSRTGVLSGRPQVSAEHRQERHRHGQIGPGLSFLHPERGGEEVVQEEQHEEGKNAHPDAQDIPDPERVPHGMPLEEHHHRHQGEDDEPEDAIDDNLLLFLCLHPSHTCRKITKHFRLPHPVR